MRFVERVNLPTRFGKFMLYCFEEREKIHLAVLKGKPKDGMLVRIHSSCFTGDVLSSLRCDCKTQLEKALYEINKKGGMLLYLDQEGRGIGLKNKLRAYALQEKNVDTVNANKILGFKADGRMYKIAARILRFFKLRSIKLMTNNLDKIRELEKDGIRVEERVPLLTKQTKENAFYLKTKAKKLGHLIDVYE